MKNKKPTLGTTSKNTRAFEQFWHSLVEQVATTAQQKKLLEEQRACYHKETQALSETVAKFQEFLKGVPIASAIAYWIQESLSDPLWQEKYVTKIEKLLAKHLIPYKDQKGNLIPLEYFIQHGHQKILEEIRCVQDWSLLEKEESVTCYVQFSHSLACQTHGLIPHGFDPDRERVQNKTIQYETFIDFASQLSNRDAIIAKLLYFGAPSIDEVLHLKTSAVNKKNLSIKFEKSTLTFPKHLILELITYIESKEKKHKIAFTNVRGAEVERAHLNQSFVRASEKMRNKEKITPGLLLKHKNIPES